MLVSLPDQIAQSQTHPFHFYAKDLSQRYGVAVREVPLSTVLSGKRYVARGATTVAFQTEFDITNADLERLIVQLKNQHPGARLVYLDWFAPTDLRLADRLNSSIDFYVKRHVFRDRARYGQPTLGDTNLTDHYMRRYNIPGEVKRFHVPSDFLNKLVVGPSFAMAPGFASMFLGRPPAAGPRPIDVHARIAVRGTPWYEAMRREAQNALTCISDLSVATGDLIQRSAFIAEMRQSKLTFSPFGYGEVCWRDFEAAMTGSVLIKPDMSHIETDPDIFRSNNTYVPLRWDLSDFEEQVRALLADPHRRQTIAARAFEVVRDYIKSDAFKNKMAPLFNE
ncbi:MAG: glycosyltransferase [Hyphomicrobium sp.]